MKMKLKRNWYIINIKNKNLGKLSANISNIIRGKLKFYYQSNKNYGDFIEIINIKYLKINNIKKIYYKHSGYPGGLKKISIENLYKKNPKTIIIKSIKNMIKTNKLKNLFLKNIKLFNNINNIYKSQKPKILNI